MLDPMLESKDPSLLDEVLGGRLEKLVAKCSHENIKLAVSATVRGPGAQGRAWCRSRTEADVVGTAASLVKVAPFIASFIRPEWSGLGPQETLELPGNSWHQWGTAVDVFAAVGASASWRGQLNLRVLYIAKGIGLRSIVWGVAGMGPKPYHLQLSQFASPIADLDGAGNWASIDLEMRKRYGG